MADLWSFPFGEKPDGALMVVWGGALVKLEEMPELDSLELSDDGTCVHIRGKNTPQVGILTSAYEDGEMQVWHPEGRTVTVFDTGDQVARWFSRLLGYDQEAGIRLVLVPSETL